MAEVPLRMQVEQLLNKLAVEKESNQDMEIIITEKTNEITMLKTKCEKLQRECEQLENELSECKTRLSKLMGNKLTDNNPAIADLSDSNRPAKLAEQFSELYDNQWTDAFEEQTDMTDDEQGKIEILLHILLNIYEMCKEESQKQTSMLWRIAYMDIDSLGRPDELTIPKDHQTDPTRHWTCETARMYDIVPEIKTGQSPSHLEMNKQIKEFRKNAAQIGLDNLFQILYTIWASNCILGMADDAAAQRRAVASERNCTGVYRHAKDNGKNDKKEQQDRHGNNVRSKEDAIHLNKVSQQDGHLRVMNQRENPVQLTNAKETRAEPVNYQLVPNDEKIITPTFHMTWACMSQANHPPIEPEHMKVDIQPKMHTTNAIEQRMDKSQYIGGTGGHAARARMNGNAIDSSASINVDSSTSLDDILKDAVFDPEQVQIVRKNVEESGYKVGQSVSSLVKKYQQQEYEQSKQEKHHAKK